MSPAIVINATNLGKYINGIGAYTLNLLRELAQLKTGNRFIVYLNRSCYEHVRDIDFPGHCEVRWVSEVVSPDLGFRGHFLRLLHSNYLGLKHRQSVMFVASQLEAIMFRRNQIIMVHDIIPLLFRQLHRKQYYYFKYALKHVLKRARWVITPSLHTKQLLIERYGVEDSKVEVIHNGVRDSLFDTTRQQPDGRRDNFILFSGRMVPMKNLGGVLRAFNLIKERIPHRVVVTGHDRIHASRKTSSARSESPSHTDRVEFRGHVSEHEMEELLSRASLVVFPSFYEGFGLPPLEGMAHGCPVVVSNVSSLPEVCGDAAHYVNPSDINSIADGMYTLLTNTDLRSELVAKGYDRAKQFQWRTSAIKHLNVFDKALQTRQHGKERPRNMWHFATVMQAHPVVALAFSILFKHHVR